MTKRKGYNGSKLDKMHSTGYYNYLCSDEFKHVYEYAASPLLGCDHIMDVGCWNGMFYRTLRYLDYTNEYFGFDLSSNAIKEADDSYGDEKTKFECKSWDDLSSHIKADGIYFGGVLYYIEDKLKFINEYINIHSPKIIVIQDLQSTDLSSLNCLGDITDKLFNVDINVNEGRRKRQVKIIKLR
jgi:SAM-dependent methyltransferase